MTTTKVIVTTREELPSFIKKKHELQDLQRMLKEVSSKAVAYLTEVLEDPKAEAKHKIECAKALITMRTDVEDQISKDSMNRLIAEIKVLPGNNTKNLSTDENENLPMLDFNTIREIK